MRQSLGVGLRAIDLQMGMIHQDNPVRAQGDEISAVGLGQLAPDEHRHQGFFEGIGDLATDAQQLKGHLLDLAAPLFREHQNAVVVRNIHGPLRVQMMNFSFSFSTMIRAPSRGSTSKTCPADLVPLV